MQRNTKPSGWGAVVAAGVGAALVTVLFFGSLLWLMLEEGPLPAVAGMALVYGLLAAAVVVGVLWAMAQRLKELRRGEDEEAKKY